MYYNAYDVKSAELEAPANKDPTHLARIHYAEYKELYDAFVNLSAPFAAFPERKKQVEWNDDWEKLKQLMETLANCAYVKSKYVYIDQQTNMPQFHPQGPLQYERMLWDVMAHRKK
ncbi:MAG: hypothetical protein K2Q45_03125 [Nitrosomonas sp.]|nr:hypothetical protein [Nitrosomonas sp.]